MTAAAATASPESNDTIPGISSRAAKSGAAMFIAKSVRFFFLIVVNFILINLLLPADFGMVRYVLLVVGVANLLNEMGLTTAIVQRKQLGRQDLWPLFLICSLWGILLYTAIYFASPFIARYFAVEELTALLRAGALVIPAAGISAVHRAWLRRNMEYGKLAMIEMCAAVLSAIVSVSLAFAGFGVWALVAGYLVFEGAISVTVLFVFRIPAGPINNPGLLGPVLLFGIAIVGSRMVDYLIGNAPFYFIGKVIGKEGLGLFSVAHDIAIFPQMAINAVLANVLVSTFSRVQTDTGKITSGFSRLLTAGSICTIPVLMVMIFMPVELLNVICMLKPNSVWLDAAPLLRWLAVMGIFYVFTTFSSSIWLAQGKIAASVGVSVFMCITIIAAIAIGVHWGLAGVCKAMVIRAVIVFPVFVYMNLFITSIPVRVFMAALVPSIVAGCAMGGTVLAVHFLLPATTVARHFIALLAGGILGMLVYGTVLLVFFRPSLDMILGMARQMMPEFTKSAGGIKRKNRV